MLCAVSPGFQKPERPGPEEREKMYLRALRPYRAAGSPDVTPHMSPRVPRPSPRLMEDLRPQVMSKTPKTPEAEHGGSESSFQTDLAQSFSEMSAGALLGEGRPWKMWDSRLSETSSSEALSLDGEGTAGTFTSPPCVQKLARLFWSPASFLVLSQSKGWH